MPCTPITCIANRYRLPAAVVELMPTDAFQRLQGDELYVVSEPVTYPAPLDLQPLLQAEAHIETEPQDLRTWVDEHLAEERSGQPLEYQIERLRKAVRSHVSAVDIGVANGTAYETFRSRRGDCSEIANLLCATLRIAGIPSRVELGLIYLARSHRWAAHAWNTAYDVETQQWIHVDASYPDFPRNLYIKIGPGNGTSLVRANGAVARFLATIGNSPIVTLDG